MRNDSYIPGALVLAYRLRKMGTQADLVCLVTPQITQVGRQTLKEVFDQVVVVDEVFIHHKMAHERQDRPFLFTRFQALRLCEGGGLGLHYDKIVLLDADIMPLSHYDQLFSLPAPAGIINEFKDHCIEEGTYGRTDGKWIWHDLYEGICPHGTAIPKGITDRVVGDPENMGVNACLWVLKPCLVEFERIMARLQQPETLDQIQAYKWPEMQLATAH